MTLPMCPFARRPRTLGSLLVAVLVAAGLVAGCQTEDPDAGRTAPNAEAAEGTVARGDNDRRAGGVVEEGTLRVLQPWVRPGAEGGTTAFYARIVSTADAIDTLYTAQTPLTDSVEIHETYDRGGGMRGMREVGPLAVPGGASVELVPGGLHVMLMDLERAVQTGDSVAVTLVFDEHPAIRVQAPVRTQVPGS